MKTTFIDKRAEALEAELGAIIAFKLSGSKASSLTVREMTKITDSLSVEVRKELIEYDKTLVMTVSE
jgi:hypothetical protein